MFGIEMMCMAVVFGLSIPTYVFNTKRLVLKVPKTVRIYK